MKTAKKIHPMFKSGDRRWRKFLCRPEPLPSASWRLPQTSHATIAGYDLSVDFDSGDIQSQLLEKSVRDKHEFFERFLFSSYTIQHMRNLCGFEVVYPNRQHYTFRELVGSSDANSRQLRESDAAENVTSYSSAEICQRLLSIDPSDRIDMHIRELVLVAEETMFSRQESENLSVWLIDFATAHKNSSNLADEPIVLSALRTAASMLTRDNVTNLDIFLEPSYQINTCIVATKMIGRIFEVNPPDRLNQYDMLAEQIENIANSLLNQYALISSQSAAMAQLAVYALAATGSTRLEGVLEKLCRLRLVWFERRTLRKLRDLRYHWENVDPKLSNLVNQAIERMQVTVEIPSGNTGAKS